MVGPRCRVSKTASGIGGCPFWARPATLALWDRSPLGAYTPGFLKFRHEILNRRLSCRHVEVTAINDRGLKPGREAWMWCRGRLLWCLTSGPDKTHRQMSSSAVKRKMAGTPHAASCRRRVVKPPTTAPSAKLRLIAPSTARRVIRRGRVPVSSIRKIAGRSAANCRWSRPTYRSLFRTA
jgi:hypothetical protein